MAPGHACNEIQMQVMKLNFRLKVLHSSAASHINWSNSKLAWKKWC